MEEGLEIVEVAAIVNTWLKPKIKDALESIEDKLEGYIDLSSHDYLKNKFEDYLKARVSSFMVIDTLVFPNYQTLLEVLYEPVTISTYNNKVDLIERISIDDFPADLFDNYYRILIQDTAGMGKSTITKKMFIDVVKNNYGIPFYIELRKINSNNSIINEIKLQLKLMDSDISEKLLFKLIERGDFVFFLDGYDEISSLSRDFVSNDIHKLLLVSDRCKFCLTSRPEAGLTSFGDFKSFKIDSLNLEQAFSLFNKYDIYAYKPISESLIDSIFDENADTNYLDINDGLIVEGLREFLENPLLVSLLYKTFDYKKSIPVNLSQFYRQVYDALYENHDLSKEGYFKREKYSKLHIDDFEKVLRCLGFLTTFKSENEFSKDNLLNLVKKSIEFYTDLNCNESEFIKDLTTTVPLFRKEAGSYKWAHKSFQDYFGAKFLFIDYPDKKNEVLLKYMKESRNNNFLKIYSSIDIKGFRAICVNYYLDSYFSFHKGIHDKYVDHLPSSLIVDLSCVLFNNELYFVFSEPEDFAIDKLNELRTTNETDASIKTPEEDDWFDYLIPTLSREFWVL